MNKSYWIWKYGDFEIYHYNLLHMRREDHGRDYPPFWKLPDTEKNVRFYCDFTADKSGNMKVFINGLGNVILDDIHYASEEEISVSCGTHSIVVCAANLTGLTAVYTESDVCPSDKRWYTLDKDNNHIPVGFDEKYDDYSTTPEKFIFSYERINPQTSLKINGGTLFDFGRETFGYLYLDSLCENAEYKVTYGETQQEALSINDAVISEKISGKAFYKLRQRAFRYIFVNSENVNAYADFEYLPLDRKGSFRCNDELINKIWEASAHTYHLNCREVLLDGIKRDRWCWSGDAYQCFKFNNYLFSDSGIVKRTLTALGGNECMTEQINTITDYTFYWIIGLYEYYMSFGDTEYLRRMYSKVVNKLEFMKSRENEDGFIIQKANDWIFIDWTEMDKEGAVCAEQMLYIAANMCASKIAKAIGEPYEKYEQRANELAAMVNKYYWNGTAFIDSYSSGRNNVTRHANIFAVMYDIATPCQRESIIENVLLNDSITAITTPFFEGFELDVMGQIGKLDYIENMIRSYWGGMVTLGATTIWEEYNPKLCGDKHYEMYEDRFGKSLCHAWGASPIYLLGKYYAGVEPTLPGYEEFVVKPQMGGFGAFECTVPVNEGTVYVKLDNKSLVVSTDKKGGTLVWNGEEYRLVPGERIEI